MPETYKDFLRSSFSERLPLFGTIEISHLCHARCAHCYLPYAHRTDGRVMDFGLFRDLLDQLEDGGCLAVSLTGGEIFGLKRFPEYYLAAASKSLRVRLQTNGILLSDRLADLFRECPPNQVSVSVYAGSPETYEQVTGCRGAYAAVIRSLERLHAMGIPLSIRMTAMRCNVGDYRAVREIAARFDAEFAPVFYLAPEGDSQGYMLKQRLEPSEVARLEFADGQTVKKFQQKRDGFASGLLSSDYAFNCRAGMNSFFINMDGELQLCAHLPSPAFDVRHRRISDVWKTEVPRHRLRRRARSLPAEECGDYAFLSMQCPARSLAWAGDPDESVPYFNSVFRARLKQWQSMKAEANNSG